MSPHGTPSTPLGRGAFRQIWWQTCRRVLSSRVQGADTDEEVRYSVCVVSPGRGAEKEASSALESLLVPVSCEFCVAFL